MTIIYEERLSDSPYVETITHGHTAGDGSTIRPAAYQWHMVVVRYRGAIQLVVTGPLSSSGVVSWTEGAEVIWIKFRLGVFMPHLPTRTLLDKETILPGAAKKSFWLKGASWQFPDHENTDVFVNRLMHDEVLVCDPLVTSVLQDQQPEVAPRTIRHRFLQTTGLTQNQIYQIERAQQAARLLEQGFSILDTVYQAGYFDQPHLTRALKRWVGHTPAEIIRTRDPQACHFVQDAGVLSEYDTTIPETVR